MTEYRFARPDEEMEVLDLINAVFSQVSRPHDFAKMLPKVYAHPGFARIHAVALEGGRIRGTIAMLPLEVRLEEGLPRLKAGYIGSVAVHPRYRGKGMMRALMDMQIEEARGQGFDFLALGGQRQRYRYHGFEKGGGEARLTVTRSNARHALPEKSSFRFQRVDGPDHPALPFMIALQSKTPFSCVRPPDLFWDTLCSYGEEPFAIWDETRNDWAGYLVIQDTDITELVLARESDLSAVIAAWMRGKTKYTVHCPAGFRERVGTLAAFVDHASVCDMEMVRILNWEKVLRTCFASRQRHCPLPEGKRVVRIENSGTWTLEVGSGGASVLPSEEEPQLTLTELQAVSLFFSPMSAMLADDGLLRAWLPLQLYVPVPDQF